MKSISLFLSVILTTTLSFAVDDTVQLSIQGVSQNTVPAQARAEALKDALEKGAINVMTSLIGATKIEKTLPTIKERIFPEINRFVQYYKASEPIKNNETTTLEVNMKISVTALRELLDQEGLLVQSDIVYNVLPVIKIFEKKPAGRQYSWWKDDFTTAQGVMKDQIKSLALQFQKTETRNFKMIDPISGKTYQEVSDRFKQGELSSSDAIVLAYELKAPLLLFGDAFISPTDKPNKFKTEFKATLYYVESSRILAEVYKVFDITSKKPNADLILQQSLRQVFTDASTTLATEMQSQLKKGVFGSQTVQIIFNSDLNYTDLENVKKQFLLKIPELRTMKERKIQKGKYTFEADLVGSMNNLAKKIETSSFDKLEISVQFTNSQSIDLKVYKRGG